MDPLNNLRCDYDEADFSVEIYNPSGFYWAKKKTYIAMSQKFPFRFLYREIQPDVVSLKYREKFCSVKKKSGYVTCVPLLVL